MGTGGLIRWQLDPTTGLLFSASRAVASVLASQTPLPGSAIPQFVERLPTFSDRRIDDAFIGVAMLEFQQKVLPDKMYAGLAEPFNRGTETPVEGSKPDQFGQGIHLTELPRIGSTEVWEFLNPTVDAHPIHIHLIQFQLINRQLIKVDSVTGNYTYRPVYDSNFPGGLFPGVRTDGTWGPITYLAGTYIPGYGPALEYSKHNGDGALGGNPRFSPFLDGPTIPPTPSESGWKDTVKVFPGYVNRFVIRWAPIVTALQAVQPGQNLYSFDPTRGPGYLLHCHILDHEDNEMMRPYLPVPKCSL